MTSTNNTNNTSNSGIGNKVKGGVKVAHGLGDVVIGETRGAIDSVEKRDSSMNNEIANRGRREIEEGIAMIKGKTLGSAAANAQSTGAGYGGGINPDGATHATGFAAPPGREYEQNSTNNANTYAAGNDGWGSGINGANPSAAANPAGFSAPPGQEYAQNSTTSRGAPTDLGRGPTAYSGGGTADVEYPTSGGPPPDYGTRTGMGNTHPTQLGARPAGEREFEGRTVQ
ncbi:hypothetical protein FB45DRAFT_919682 [Roridomyces roridus]|uniref:Uncharacterized protein n=1 Tax=Roridomyces roridus TaxID=1738132 RepID=A0AAD7BSB0_9AGAR|nr:hypothetical protein FB45DRAFT_919682 [Roridomyces roridus]